MFKSLPVGQTSLQASLLVMRLERVCTKPQSPTEGAERQQVQKFRSPSGMMPPSSTPPALKTAAGERSTRTAAQQPQHPEEHGTARGWQRGLEARQFIRRFGS